MQLRAQALGKTRGKAQALKGRKNNRFTDRHEELSARAHHDYRRGRSRRALLRLNRDGEGLGLNPSRDRRIDHHCPAMRIWLKNACRNRCTLLGNDPELISFLRRQRKQVVGYKNQPVVMPRVDGLALWSWLKADR